MGAYQQMGHQSEGLILEAELSSYAGIVLSPVNYPEAELSAIVQKATAFRSFDVIFDPQLYVPKSKRGCLTKWSYFPKQAATADVRSEKWWSDIQKSVAKVARAIKADGVASAADVPKRYSDEYFEHLVVSANQLRAQLTKPTDPRAIQTAIVNLPDLSASERVLSISSILSRTDCEEIYLVLHSDQNPRHELADEEELKGAMKLITLLEHAGLKVLVGFCSSDVILWKAAGASHCASGKHFNVRRFTPSRFGPESKGGGQLPYWFEESLLAYLRQGDLIRVRAAGLLSAASNANPYGVSVLSKLTPPQGKEAEAWLGDSWRQFLHWFANVEGRLAQGTANALDLCRVADANWVALDKADILMEERRNTGEWIRHWIRALKEHQPE